LSIRIRYLRNRTRLTNQSLIDVLPLLFLPAGKSWYSSSEKASQKARDTKLNHLLADATLHLLDGDVGQNEPAILATMAAIDCALRAICIGASAFLVALQWHAATLAALICLLHVSSAGPRSTFKSTIKEQVGRELQLTSENLLENPNVQELGRLFPVKRL
jgi:hypothetical protein